MIAIVVLLAVFFTFIIIELLNYWIPFIASVRGKPETPVKVSCAGEELPFLFAVVSCHNAADLLPDILSALNKQEYPKDRYKVVVSVDNCTDDSLETARSFGVDVCVRNDAGRIGKGYALNELLQNRFKNEIFDGLVLFDIDARVDTDFFSNTAGYLIKGYEVMQGATIAKNPNESEWTVAGSFIQCLLRAHQFGRACLGLQPLMIGSHGIILSYDSLVRLGWCISTGRSGDDLELGLRCYLNKVDVRYCHDLHVYNELPWDAASIKKQRLRWTCNSLRLAPCYLLPVLKELLRGDCRAFDVIFGTLFLTSFSTLFLLLIVAVAFLGVLSFWLPFLYGWLYLAFSMFLVYTLYLWLVVKKEGFVLNSKICMVFAKYLCVKLVSLIQSVFVFRLKKWWPTEHKRKGSDNVRY